jgi:hypothetical protein
MSVIRHYDSADARREAIVEAMKRHVRAARLDAEYDADIEYMEHALVALVDEQLAGAVEARDEYKAEAWRLQTLINEAAKREPETCRAWIQDAASAVFGGQ